MSIGYDPACHPNHDTLCQTRIPAAPRRGLDVDGEVDILQAPGWGFRGTLVGNVQVRSEPDCGATGRSDQARQVVVDGTYDGIFFAPGITFVGQATGKVSLSRSLMEGPGCIPLPASELVDAHEPRRASRNSRFCLQAIAVDDPDMPKLDSDRQFWSGPASSWFYLLKSDHVTWMPVSNLVHGHHCTTYLLRRSVLRKLGISTRAIDPGGAAVITICSMGHERVVSRGTLDIEFRLYSEWKDTARFVARFHVVDGHRPFKKCGADALFVDGDVEPAVIVRR